MVCKRALLPQGFLNTPAVEIQVPETTPITKKLNIYKRRARGFVLYKFVRFSMRRIILLIRYTLLLTVVDCSGNKQDQQRITSTAKVYSLILVDSLKDIVRVIKVDEYIDSPFNSNHRRYDVKNLTGSEGS